MPISFEDLPREGRAVKGSLLLQNRKSQRNPHTLIPKRQWTLLRLQRQEYGMGKQEEGFFLSQRENLTRNTFVNLELDLEYLVRKEQEGILTKNNFV